MFTIYFHKKQKIYINIYKYIVNNQSYNYILYFLEQIREQYLIDFPSNTLVDNLDLVNVDFLLKRAKDFYLSKGTPQGIDYYFKFLFQEKIQLLLMI